MTFKKFSLYRFNTPELTVGGGGEGVKKFELSIDVTYDRPLYCGFYPIFCSLEKIPIFAVVKLKFLLSVE